METARVAKHNKAKWLRRTFLVISLTLVLPDLTLDAHADSALADYIQTGLIDFETSERVIRTRAVMEVLAATGEEAAIESPYSIQAAASQNLNQLPDGPAVRPRANTAASGSLRMRKRSGLEAGISGSVDYSRIAASNFYPYQVSVDIAYDLTQGGDTGVAKTIERIAINSARQNLLQTKQTLVDLRVEYISLLIDLYSANCTLLQQRESKERVAKTVEVATVMRKTRTMSNKDFLNFVQVQNSFERDIASSESLVRILQEQVRRWGDGAYVKAKATISKIQSCENEVDATLARVETLAVSADRIAEIATLQPAAAAAKEAVAGAELRLRLEKMDRKASISPFMQLDVGQSGLLRDDLFSLFFGVRLDWQPRTKRRSAAERVRKLGVVEARNGRDLVLLDNRARLHTLWVEIQTQTQVIASLRSSIETSRELIKTLETERSVGLVDSLSYNNALINSNATKLQLLGSWAALERSMLEFEVYLSLAKK